MSAPVRARYGDWGEELSGQISGPAGRTFPARTGRRHDRTRDVHLALRKPLTRGAGHDTQSLISPSPQARVAPIACLRLCARASRTQARPLTRSPPPAVGCAHAWLRLALAPRSAKQTMTDAASLPLRSSSPIGRLFDLPEARSNFSSTPFAPAPSEGYGAQGGSKAPPLGGGSEATRSLRQQARMAGARLLMRPSTVARSGPRMHAAGLGPPAGRAVVAPHPRLPQRIVAGPWMTGLWPPKGFV